MTIEKGLKRPLNLWLDEDANGILETEKRSTGKSRASLVNQAIRIAYKEKRPSS